MGCMLCMGGVNYLGLVVGMVSMEDLENFNIMCSWVGIEWVKLMVVVEVLGCLYVKNF